MHGWYAAARVVGMKGLEGKLRLADASAFLRSAHPGMQVAFVPPRQDAPRFASVDALEGDAAGGCIAVFEGVADRSVAERLSGCTVLLKGEAPEEEMASAPFSSIQGFVVEDVSAGEVGVVEAVDAGPDRVQPLITVAREGAPSALIPLVDELIVRVDEEGQRLIMQLPAGLLDI